MFHTLQQPLHDLILRNDVNMRSPARQRIPINRIQQRLRASLEQVLRLKIRLPHALAGSEKLVARRAAHDEILGEIDTPDGVEAADERLACAVVDPCDHGGNIVGAEATLVQGRRDEVRHGFGFDGALFAEAVEVYFVAEELGPALRGGWELVGETAGWGMAADIVVTSVARPVNPRYASP